MKIENLIQLNKRSPFLKELHFVRKITDEGASDYDLEMSLSTFPAYESADSLTIKFLGLKNIKLDNINGLHQVLLSIEDISINHIEDANYHVNDISGGNISFLCVDFEITGQA